MDILDCDISCIDPTGDTKSDVVAEIECVLGKNSGIELEEEVLISIAEELLACTVDVKSDTTCLSKGIGSIDGTFDCEVDISLLESSITGDTGCDLFLSIVDLQAAAEIAVFGKCELIENSVTTGFCCKTISKLEGLCLSMTPDVV